MSQPLPPPFPGQVAVGSLAQAMRHKRKWDAVLTLEDPEARPGDRLRFTNGDGPQHCILAFEDCDSEAFGYATATPDQVAEALEFGRNHTRSALLVHCFHGVGRSAAIALAILADRMGPGHETSAILALGTVRPTTTPNLVVVEHADALLGRDGALLRALHEFESVRPALLMARRRRYEFAIANPSLYSKRS